ncbi:hypothetical protein SLUN_02205 [Streptomyces lunaelactis]|uniref:Uncharacterized protein n=1 Tax=Streptomyces lunaelactis TaxID=1535768 RepID=A0A2R4SWK0_9ACTN|nr:hypothetical protein [Streptomyces lunaelactis]AVZ71224.1 hypothetical protein SLUN_02205 [Streptomyces lunaelactis]NUK87974.1 hypothetical protein [Streptomyces lunaelactis]
MRGIRHRRAMPVQTAPGEFGRGAWIVIGASTIAVAAAFHAVAGVAEILRDIMRNEPRNTYGKGESPAVVPERLAHEAAGWVLIVGAVMALGALSHAVATLAELVRDILRTKAQATPQ